MKSGEQIVSSIRAEHLIVIVRGEETELMGILQQEQASDALYVLPGSHSKLIDVDKAGRITSFCTAMTGELFAAVSRHTILKSAVDPQEAEIDEAELCRGYGVCSRLGLNRTLFAVRMKRNFFGGSDPGCYSYLLGAILCGEIGQIIASEKQTVILGGQKQRREATAALLRNRSAKNIVLLPDPVVGQATVRGAIRIFETER